MRRHRSRTPGSRRPKSQLLRRRPIQPTATTIPSSASTYPCGASATAEWMNVPPGHVDRRHERAEREQQGRVSEVRPERRVPPPPPRPDEQERDQDQRPDEDAEDERGRHEPAHAGQQQRPPAHAQEMVQGRRDRDAVPLADVADEQHLAGRGRWRERPEHRQLAQVPGRDGTANSATAPTRRTGSGPGAWARRRSRGPSAGGPTGTWPQHARAPGRRRCARAWRGRPAAPRARRPGRCPAGPARRGTASRRPAAGTARSCPAGPCRRKRAPAARLARPHPRSRTRAHPRPARSPTRAAPRTPRRSRTGSPRPSPSAPAAR